MLSQDFFDKDAWADGPFLTPPRRLHPRVADALVVGAVLVTAAVTFAVSELGSYSAGYRQGYADQTDQRVASLGTVVREGDCYGGGRGFRCVKTADGQLWSIARTKVLP